MNEDFIRAVQANVAATLRAFPIGTLVWLRASGQRCIVDGVIVCGDGGALPRINNGNQQSLVFPFEVSKSPVPFTDDGDEWKEPAET